MDAALANLEAPHGVVLWNPGLPKGTAHSIGKRRSEHSDE